MRKASDITNNCLQIKAFMEGIEKIVKTGVRKVVVKGNWLSILVTPLPKPVVLKVGPNARKWTQNMRAFIGLERAPNILGGL